MDAAYEWLHAGAKIVALDVIPAPSAAAVSAAAEPGGNPLDFGGLPNLFEARDFAESLRVCFGKELAARRGRIVARMRLGIGGSILSQLHVLGTALGQLRPAVGAVQVVLPEGTMTEAIEAFAAMPKAGELGERLKEACGSDSDRDYLGVTFEWPTRNLNGSEALSRQCCSLTTTVGLHHTLGGIHVIAPSIIRTDEAMNAAADAMAQAKLIRSGNEKSAKREGKTSSAARGDGVRSFVGPAMAAAAIAASGTVLLKGTKAPSGGVVAAAATAAGALAVRRYFAAQVAVTEGGLATASSNGVVEEEGGGEEDALAGKHSNDLIDHFLACLVSDRADGLYTTVVCDRSGVALGLVYSSRASVRAAVLCGRGVYWSRSRVSLWRKGDTSGAWQALHRIDMDCDGDALRFTVRQNGEDADGAPCPAFCHRNCYTCWGARCGLGDLEQTLFSRKATAPEGSYTKRLFDDSKLLHDKLLEESQELMEATEPDHVAAEAADVFYFALAKCAKEGTYVVTHE